MEKVFVTLEKFRDLRQEVKRLKTSERKNIADKLSQFRDSSDLLEDSSYTEILQEQANLEEKIDELEEILEFASIIKERKSEKARIGSTVVMTVLGTRKRITVKIVGSIDANPLNKEISNESPLGMALLGKKKSETIEILTPSGKSSYKILEIK